MKEINLHAELSEQKLDKFFSSFTSVIKGLNQIIEQKNGKKDAISISKTNSDISISYKKTPKSNGMFCDVTIKQDEEFDFRLEYAIQVVFNACRDNDCYELVRVYGAKERGQTMGFKYTIADQDYDCILWKRPEVIYIVMRHAEPTESGGDLTSKGYKQAHEVVTKIKNLFPDEKKWKENSFINLPSGVLRITMTAQTVVSGLGENIDDFNIERCQWLGLQALHQDNIYWGAHNMTQNTDFRYQFMFTHNDVAAEVFSTFTKDMALQEDLSGYMLGLAECIVIYPDGKVLKLEPDIR